MKYVQVLFVILTVSCQNEEVKNQVAKEDVNFFNEQLGLILEERTLSIYCEFNECGEWGGHEEYIVVSKKDNNSFKLNYEKYSADCDSMVQEFDGMGYIIRPKKVLIKTKEIDLENKGKQAILDFSYEMVRSKFKEEFPGHAGLVLSIANSDSTFFIRTYGGNANHYLILVNELNLEK